MKASIITLQTAVNYGSLLQTYATMQVFARLGWQVEFVDYTRANNTMEAQARRMFRPRWFKALDRLSCGLATRVALPWAVKRAAKRAAPFREFLARNHIPLTPRRYADIGELRADPPVADVYCTGSDQVWNSIWNGGLELPYFLDYAPEGKKRIAFAASIGRTDLDQDEKDGMAPLLRKYSAISMREKSGADIVESMGIPAEWVLDPTLMLKKEEWLALAPPLPPPKRPCLLLYVLNWDARAARLARTMAERHGWTIRRITKNKQKPFSAEKGIEVVVLRSVEEWLAHFRDADCILTDSFHATAFSVNFHKPFIAIPPPRFPGRLESILQLVRLENRMYRGGEMTDPGAPIDWQAVDAILNRERAKSWRFLENALGTGSPR